MRIAAVAAFANLHESELRIWIERGWVRPEPEGPEFFFHEVDLARVRLIRDLRFGMDLRDDAIPLVLSLLDQVYELRGVIRSVLTVTENQPPAVRNAILEAILPIRP